MALNVVAGRPLEPGKVQYSTTNFFDQLFLIGTEHELHHPLLAILLISVVGMSSKRWCHSCSVPIGAY